MIGDAIHDRQRRPRESAEDSARQDLVHLIASSA